MKKLLTCLIGLIIYQFSAMAQCTTTNATSCQCDNITSTNCDLLPDITISWYALENYLSGPTEYAQTGSGVNNGRLKVSGSTPNIGHGPLTVRGESNSGIRKFLCGTDTFTFPATGTFTCPNGYPIPKQITTQRVYHKNGSTMTYWDRNTAAMTYHPTHNHIHFDDWGIFTLRIKDPLIPDPRDWSIVGNGHKLGFCLMDYGTCTYYDQHCRDVNTVYSGGTNMTNGDFPNWGLGGGVYNCSVVEQGISSGYTDIYSENLDGMWINIPPGTCNGNYWIVYEVDPHDAILEEDETNNYTAIPFTLTLQSPAGSPTIKINSDRSPNLCTGELIKLTATAGTTYLWSTGQTTQSIWVGPGTYSVTVTNYCGTGSASFTVASSTTPAAPTASNDTICSGTSTTLSATGANVVWYDGTSSELGTGNNFTTPILTSSTTYYAQNEIYYPGVLGKIGKFDTTSTGGYSSSANYCLFEVFRPITLKSVKVSANGAGNRTIQLFDEIGIIQNGGIYNIPAGTTRVNLNYTILPGKNYSLQVTSPSPNLWRNTAGTSYPYTKVDTISITGSSSGASNYYYFYDWEIEVGGTTCISPQIPVTAFVEVCTGIDDNWDLTNNIRVFPNPSNGEFTFNILMPGSGDANIKVSDMVGREIYSQKLENISGENSTVIDLKNMTQGIYLLDVRIGNKNYFRKLIKQ